VARTLNYLQAIAEAQLEEMRRDPTVFIMGEDIQSGLYGNLALDEFGTDRIRNTPISEAGFVGAGVGAAMTGMRPIVDLGCTAFIYCAMDQLVSQAAKNRYIFGGQATIPLVVRAAMYYGGTALAAHHADRPYPMFMNVPGLKIIVPSSPYDAMGLLKSAIREDDPVLCFEDVTLWGATQELPEEEVLVPLGRAEVKRSGSDVTVVAIGGSVPHALKAGDELASEGISVEVLDPRTLVPLDWDAVLESVAKTHRLVLVDPANRTCGAAAEIAATVAEDLFWSLRAPIVRVTTPDTHVPFCPIIERPLYPDKAAVLAAVRSVMQERPHDVVPSR
jgi:acetoin:2,6-dichlorophenolindophenol oxidoreductase subunit beta